MATPVATSPKATKHRSAWWLIPLILLVVGGLAWLLLAGLPFGNREKPVERPKTETIAESTAPPVDTGTILEGPGESTPTIIEGEDDTGSISTTTMAAPPNVDTAPQGAIPTATIPTATVAPPTATVPRQTPPATATVPRRTPPATTTVVTAPRPAPVPTPVPIRRPPAATPPSPSGEISESEATAVLRGYVTSRNYYKVASECVRINSRGYRNVGYTFEVWHACAGGGASRLLGRWRVDSKTREVFRQQDDGRYLRP